MQKISVSAYAKINLYLDVLSKYENGYHEVNTVMQTVSLSDTLTLKKREDGIYVSCSDISLPCDRNNIVYRAAELFFEKSSVDGGADILIEKNIPVAAGLAGGSADAAATLKALNSLYGEPFDKEALLTLASSLGADVPFCLEGGTAYADGKGDRLLEVSPLPNCYIVISRSGEGVSTPWAYGELDRIYSDFSTGKRESSAIALIEALGEGDLSSVCRNVKNVFEDAVIPYRSAVGEIKQRLLSDGALCAMMSGSGTAVFGIFDDENQARCSVEKLIGEGMFAAFSVPTKKKL